MDKIPDNILNPDLYRQAKRKADAIFEKHGAYKSMYIQTQYKKLGGKYKGKKPTQGVTRWNKEKWVQVLPYLKNGKEISCGFDNKKDKVCRPLVRINKDTPITLPELQKLHSKKELMELANKKIRDMKGRVFWKTLKFTPSKK